MTFHAVDALNAPVSYLPDFRKKTRLRKGTGAGARRQVGESLHSVHRVHGWSERLYVEGRMEYSQSDGPHGPKYWTDIVVREMVMLGSTKGTDAP